MTQRIRAVLALATLLAGAPVAAHAGASVSSTQATLSGVGPGNPLAMNYRIGQGIGQGYFLPPSVLVGLSNGASLTYKVEVTGDLPDANGNFSPSANWFPMDASAVGLTASQNFPIVSMVTAVRANVTSYTGGSLVIELVQ